MWTLLLVSSQWVQKRGEWRHGEHSEHRSVCQQLWLCPVCRTETCCATSSGTESRFKISFCICFPVLPDQLCVELLQVHQQQEHVRDCSLPGLWDPTPGMQAALIDRCEFYEKYLVIKAHVAVLDAALCNAHGKPAGGMPSPHRSEKLRKESASVHEVAATFQNVYKAEFKDPQFQFKKVVWTRMLHWCGTWRAVLSHLCIQSSLCIGCCV